MVVGIVGLGLIGGSFAKAYSNHDDHEVLGFDIDEKIMTIDEILDEIEK